MKGIKVTGKVMVSAVMITMLAVSGVAGCGKTKEKAAGDSADQKTAKEDETYQFSLFGNIAPELKESDKVFFDELMKQTNTKIDVTIPPSSNYNEALTVMLAGGDYPDLVLFPDSNSTAFQDAVRNGAILPLNKYLKNAPNIKKYSYDVSMQNLEVMGDGEVYAIPRSSAARADGFIIRKDWLDKLGIPFEEGKPITRDQFTEILDAFTTQDPDGNGKDDTYGLGLYTADGNLDVVDPIKWSYGLSGWQEVTDEDYDYLDPVYSKKDQTYKEALDYFHKLWDKQYIDPDWPTLNQEAMLTRFEQGVLGVIPDFSGWMPYREDSLKKNDPNAELAYVVGIVENEGDKVQAGINTTGMFGCWAIMNTAKNPQKIVDVLDYILSDDFWNTTMYGVEGSSWEYDDNHNRVMIPDSDYGAGRNIMRRNDSAEFFVGITTPVEERDRITKLIDICVNQAFFSKDEGFRPKVVDEPTYIDADKERKVTISKIIAGDLPVSEYDSALDNWYKNDGKTYIEQMNQHIKSDQ